MPSYDKLPSGKWRGRGRIDGRVVSVTAETRREAVQKLEDRLGVRNGGMTVGEAVRKYIEQGESVYSPSTIRAYWSVANNRFQTLQRFRLADVTEDDVAREINKEARNHSPKTVHNAWGLIRSAIAPYVPMQNWRIRLPQKTKTEPYIPTPDEVAQLIESVAGTKYEIPFKLAAYCGLRRSEICALTYNDVRDGYVTVNKAVVPDKSGEWREKQPKTISGYRRVKLPKNVKIEGEGAGRITDLTPVALSRKCSRLSHNRFSIHDLRHYYASVLLRLGVPNKYAAKQMGHATENMLQKVYQHLFANAEAEYDALIADRVVDMR